MAMPMMSFVVVINGPVANAGSIFIRLSIIGIVEPTIAAKVTTISNDIPEVRDLPKSLVKYKDIKVRIIEQIKPFKSPTRNSFQRRISMSVVCIAPVASPRTTIVEDWIPILPPSAATSGMK
jgi:hypothetical protein